jgi:hypothetical protein
MPGWIAVAMLNFNHPAVRPTCKRKEPLRTKMNKGCYQLSINLSQEEKLRTGDNILVTTLVTLVTPVPLAPGTG